MSRFPDTPFNQECPHHSMVLGSAVERCPWCGEEDRRVVMRRWMDLSVALAELVSAIFLLWLVLRGVA